MARGHRARIDLELARQASHGIAFLHGQLVQRQPLHIGQVMGRQALIGVVADRAQHIAHEVPDAAVGPELARNVERRRGRRDVFGLIFLHVCILVA
jgi:hypothetical protein